jgi:hypothetical protein
MEGLLGVPTQTAGLEMGWKWVGNVFIAFTLFHQKPFEWAAHEALDKR